MGRELVDMGKRMLANRISFIFPQYDSDVLEYMNEDTFDAFCNSAPVQRVIVESNLFPEKVIKINFLMEERFPDALPIPHRRNSRSPHW